MGVIASDADASTADESSRKARVVEMKMNQQIRRFTRKVEAAKRKIVESDAKVKKLVRDGITDEKILRAGIKNSMLWEKNHIRMLGVLATMQAAQVKFAEIAATQQIVANYAQTTTALKSMEDMQPETVESIMERFKEAVFNAEIVSKTVEEATKMVTVEDATQEGESVQEIDARLARIRDETALGVSRAMPEAPGKTPAFAAEEEELERRLAVLRTDDGD